MKNLILATIFLAATACSDDRDLLVPIPNDVTMNELSLDRFTHVIPENGFTSRAAHQNAVTFNTNKKSDGTYAGFAYSNRNNRSFTWTATPQALDSNIFSVYTRYPNATEVYAVARVDGDDAFFTLETPAVVEHVLVANTTYAYLALVYGDQYGTSAAPVANPNIPGGAAKTGVWYANVPGGVKKMVDEDADYFKLTAKGYNGNTATGEVTFYLCTRKGDPANPAWSLVVNDWYRVDLASLGVVSRVVFYLESSDLDVGGNMRTPPYFCLDGIRLAR
ncbi:MAG: DUF4465 domain-containing protein [Odoribacteraceae bacterium]|jgi:hypothetical protein|nr:DUF4465 domain-containing protein [Odoribacteraceae bacterium]